MTTTNMSLNEPSVGTTTGPTWATQVNENFTTIDQHDHTSGKGVQLTTSALNINADLEFNGNAATELKRMTIDSSSTGSGTNYSVYQSGGNLFWYNGSGQAVQITDGAAVKTTGGSISGMSTDAAVQFAVNAYVFKWDTTTSPQSVAKISCSDISIYNFSNYNDLVTLKYTGSGASSELTLPDETGTLLSTATSFAGAINIDATGGSGSITLDAATSVSIEADTTITLDAEGDINLDSNSGVLTFKDNGTAIGKISNSSSDLVIENEVDAKDIIFKQYDGNEVVRMADDRRLYFYDKGGEYILGNGTNLTIASGANIELTATGKVNIPSTVEVTFGNNTENIYGNGANLILQAATDINLTATSDINVPANVGLTFGNDGEKIEGNGTKLDIAASELDFSIESGGDINIGANIGLTFGNDGEKIEGDGTDLTIASSNNMTLDAEGDVVIDANGGDFTLKDDGTAFLTVSFSGGNTTITGP